MRLPKSAIFWNRDRPRIGPEGVPVSRCKGLTPEPGCPIALLAPPPQRETRPLEAIESISTGNGTPVAVRDVNHDANVIAELDATWMSFPRGAMLPSARPPGRGKRALPLTRPLGRFCDFGGRSRSNIMKSLLKVEAAGIEPASESTPLFGATCLSRDLSSSGGSSTGPLPAGPSPNESRLPPSERHGRPADFFDGTCRRHQLGSGVPRA